MSSVTSVTPGTASSFEGIAPEASCPTLKQVIVTEIVGIETVTRNDDPRTISPLHKNHLVFDRRGSKNPKTGKFWIEEFHYKQVMAGNPFILHIWLRMGISGDGELYRHNPDPRKIRRNIFDKQTAFLSCDKKDLQALVSNAFKMFPLKWIGTVLLEMPEFRDWNAQGDYCGNEKNLVAIIERYAAIILCDESSC